ncbi:energy transducer TonB [Desulfocicer niacini]
MQHTAMYITAHPWRKLFLTSTGILLGTGVLALIPFLMHHTSMKHRNFPTREIRLIAQEPPSLIEPFQEKIPEVPPPPPEPDIDIPPPELPDPIVQELPEPPVPATPHPEPVELLPLQQPLVASVNLPSLCALDVKGVPVQAGLSGSGVRFSKIPVPGHLPVPRTPIKKPVNKIRFNMNELDTPPEKISAIQPMYPYRAKRMNIEGMVSVKFLVDRSGNVREPAVIKADPSDIFEETVIKTIKKWRFKPGKKDGKTVETWIKTSIEFKLEQS